MRPPITITSMWIDWVMLPVVLGAGWLILRLAQADMRKVAELDPGAFTLPSWTVVLPLATCAVAFVVMGLGMLIREEYWEHRALCLTQILFVISCIIGSGLVLHSLFVGSSRFGSAGILELLGLLLMVIVLILPAFLDPLNQELVVSASRMWYVLSALGMGLLILGVLWGFPFNFSRFPLGIGAVYLFGLGLFELTFGYPAFPWMVTLWKVDLGYEYVKTFTMASVLPGESWLKMLVGVVVGVFLAVVSLRGRG